MESEGHKSGGQLLVCLSDDRKRKGEEYAAAVLLLPLLGLYRRVCGCFRVFAGPVGGNVLRRTHSGGLSAGDPGAHPGGNGCLLFALAAFQGEAADPGQLRMDVPAGCGLSHYDAGAHAKRAGDQEAVFTVLRPGGACSGPVGLRPFRLPVLPALDAPPRRGCSGTKTE